MNEYDRFDDNTFAVEISLAEYRELIRIQARHEFEMDRLYEQINSLQAALDAAVESHASVQEQMALDD